MDGTAGQPRVIDLRETARLLSLSEHGVRALADAGYLHAVDPESWQFALGDVKAFLARVADDSPRVDVLTDELDAVDPVDLLDALDGRAEEMAERAFDVFQQAFPDA